MAEGSSLHHRRNIDDRSGKTRIGGSGVGLKEERVALEKLKSEERLPVGVEEEEEEVAASRGGGGFDRVMACREEWEMSPGGADLVRVEAGSPPFCSARRLRNTLEPHGVGSFSWRH